VPGGASVIHVALIRLRRLLAKEQSQLLERTAGISIPEWRILYLLATFGPMSQSELLKKTVIEQAQASRVIRSMAAAGLTVLKRDPDDLRRWTCSLTERGRQVFEKVEPVMQARRNFLDSVLTEEEFAQFTEFANRIAERVQWAMNDASV
jgi:DNA-binding MarR family transcriptional regulator